MKQLHPEAFLCSPCRYLSQKPLKGLDPYVLTPPPSLPTYPTPGPPTPQPAHFSPFPLPLPFYPSACHRHAVTLLTNPQTPEHNLTCHSCSLPDTLQNLFTALRITFEIPGLEDPLYSSPASLTLPPPSAQIPPRCFLNCFLPTQFS